MGINHPTLRVALIILITVAISSPTNGLPMDGMCDLTSAQLCQSACPDEMSALLALATITEESVQDFCPWYGH